MEKRFEIEEIKKIETKLEGPKYQKQQLIKLKKSYPTKVFVKAQKVLCLIKDLKADK